MVSEKIKKYIRKVLLLLFPLCLLLGTVFSYYSVHQYDMGIVSYEVQSGKTKAPFRIVVISDLHNHEYGENNSELEKKIMEQKPDMIAITGDTVMKNSSDLSVLESILAMAPKIAPTYCCLGNHEKNLEERGINVKEVFRNSDAILLDDEIIYTEIDGNRLCIAGITYNPDAGTPSRKILDEFEKETVCFKLLLCHYPAYKWCIMNYHIDLCLSGHRHGGQIRFPGIGVLYFPAEGFFPEYVVGDYKSDTAEMIISGGLGNSRIIPRINNPAELTVIDIQASG